MFNVLKAWFLKYFGDPEAAILLIAIALTALILWIFGHILAPIFAGLILAYLLDGLITSFARFFHAPRWIAISFVFSIFTGLLVYAIIALIPTLYKQILQFLTQLPQILAEFHTFVSNLPTRYPGLISANTAQSWITSTNFNFSSLSSIGDTIFSGSVASLSTIASWIIYVFLVPLLAFFFLKDKRRLLSGVNEYMPDQRGLILEVWHEMKTMLGRYVRGKVFEVLIVTAITWLAFRILNLNYAFLLAAIAGISAVIPYIGAFVAALPVFAIAILQWGPEPHFYWALIAYTVIQVLDGNLLVPLLYSEAVNLNPVLIITAVLFFGGIWGFWGLFFAIPLATFVKVVINAWIRHANLREDVASAHKPLKSA